MGETKKTILTPEITEQIMKIIRRGNSAEIKKEHNRLVVVEIRRTKKGTTSIIG